MPVRVKHRALHQQDSMEAERQWEEIKLGIVALLLAWDESVSLKVTNIETRRSMSLIERPHTLSGGTVSTNGIAEGLLKAPNLLMSAGYTSQQTWIPATASSRQLTIKGIIGLQPTATRQLQFVSVGIRTLSASLGHNEIFDHINRLFKRSTFGTSDDEPADARDRAAMTPRKSPRTLSPSKNEPKMSRKGVEKWPMFCLKVIFHDRSAERGHLLQHSLTHASLRRQHVWCPG